MIVKDESSVICRCLASVKPLIDYWVILDTGSTDGTQDLIRNFMKDIPGELHESPWINFAHNRNEALALAKNKADYILFIDADEVLSFASDFKLPALDKDFYLIASEYGGGKYYRAQLVKNQLNWKWEGVVHEAIISDQAQSVEILADVTNHVHTDGCRSQDPQKYQKDAKLLEASIKENPNDTRTMFYLAQSYKDALEYDHALEVYQKRIGMGGWDQEVFWSLLMVGRLKELLKMPSQDVIKSYFEAYRFRPTRAEPLYYLANYYRSIGDCQKGYQVAKEGLTISLPQDLLLVEKWVYDYGLLMEFSICAYWTDKFVEAQLASQLLLTQSFLPSFVRDRILQNLAFVNAKILETKQKALLQQILEL